MDKIEIPLSKGRLLLILLGGLLFVVFGVIFIINPEKFISARMSNPELLRLLGIASFLFFGILSTYALRKLFGDPIGLIIDEEGITDHTSASAVGLIKWHDITEVRVVQVKSTRFLLLYVANPAEYLDKAKGLKKMFMKGNHSMYGTPLSIASNTLQYKFNDLEKLITEQLSNIRSSKPSDHL
jgi:hypothetical protein